MDFYISLHPQIRKGGIAQLVEHLLCKQRVAGSNPTTSTGKRPQDYFLRPFCYPKLFWLGLFLLLQQGQEGVGLVCCDDINAEIDPVFEV